jgi:acetyl/propionyl-CoA carboxylase alpha subunit
VRVDAGFHSGDEVPPHYDSLLAKVIVQAPSRAAALRRLDQALADYALLGLTTNRDYLRAILAHPEFQAGAATTRFVPEHMATWQPAAGPPPALVAVAAALADHLAGQRGPAGGPDGTAMDRSPWSRTDGFRIGGA